MPASVTARKENVELLRCLLMALIVLGHCRRYSIFPMSVCKVQLPDRLDKTGAFLAPSMFGVYLLHETTAFGHELFRVPQRWMAAHLNLPAPVVIIISAVMTFFLCVAVDLVRRFMASLFMSRLRFLSNMKGRGAR